MPKITKRCVDAINAGNKDAYLWDAELSGFGLKVTPAGRKVFIIQYRLGGRKGRTRRITIGAYGNFTPDQARTVAKRLLGEVAAGRDPAEQADRARASLSLRAALNQFLGDHVHTKLKASTSTEYGRLARLHILPTLGNRRIDDVKRADIAQLHLSMRDKPYQANRVIAMLSKFFNWLEKHGQRPDGSNPCRHIERFREDKRERFLSADEISRLGSALLKAEQQDLASPWAIAAVRLLALTGARLSEILSMTWKQVDLESQRVRLTDSKTGPKTIYLPPAAVSLLQVLPQLEENQYVICGAVPGARLVNLQKPWRRIRNLANLDDVRLHDLRHTFASVAAAGGASLPMIGALLSHSQPQTTQRYAHLVGAPVQDAANSIGREISDALSLNQRSSRA